jgi:hypothetical protein
MKELPRLRIIVRVTWTMLLSRICSTSVLETPMKQSPADAVAAPTASPSMFSLSKATPAPTQPPSRSNKSDTSVSFVKTEYYDYFGNEVNKLLGVHKKTAAAIVDKTLLEGAHHEVIQSLRLLQRSFEYEIDSLCRRCFEDFIIDTCDEVLLPYGFGEEGDDFTRLRRSSSSPAKLTRKDVATTPAKAEDCTAADCSMS